MIDIYQENKSAVVTVYAAHNPEQDDGRPALFIGTGFFISRDGHILTNTNTIFGADRIWVERDGVGYIAENIGSDPLTNVAIIKALALPSDFKYLRFTEKPNPPEIGSIVVALTSEIGMAPGPSMGLINGWNTRYGDRILPTIYLRSDVPFDGGEGGSPIFDISGSLVGMMIVALPEIRSSFILPARAVQRIRDDILFSGKVTFAHFGFSTMQKPDFTNGPHVEVEDVDPNGPAGKGGIQAGDILIKVGDFEIKTDENLRTAFFYTRPHELVTVAVKRGEETLELPIRVGVREAPPTAMPPVQKSPEETYESLQGPRPDDSGDKAAKPTQAADSQTQDLATPTAQESTDSPPVETMEASSPETASEPLTPSPKENDAAMGS
ncbi:S1C family serine protease [Cerasicoccus fimbriatus]|uniref:S1C family serine protease n=1 Tax=Cerasicoccus fimbriatus TaxID=3014554 RepID=UPI0022B4B242|nr:trypsin-like peptidase domain-containing protein [Cerasicoccus sp. TK19100]